VWPGIEPVGPGEYVNQAMLQSAVARPFQSIGGEDAYTTLQKKGAALFHSLIANHPFQNGNKRTAVLATHSFFFANSHFLFLLPHEMLELAKSAASYRERGLTHDQIFCEIENKLGGNLASFELIKTESTLAHLYAGAVKARRFVRRELRRLRPPSQPM
jgi:death-on-curing family protein